MTTVSSFVNCSDDELTAQVTQWAACERQATAALVAALAEFDLRRLYLAAGCSSLFAYCTRVLHLSEHAAYLRIEAARAVRRFPVLLAHLSDGAITLTTASLLIPLLTPEDYEGLLAAARHKSKSEVEHLVATLRPKPPVPTSIRRLSIASGGRAPAPSASVLSSAPGVADAADVSLAMAQGPAQFAGVFEEPKAAEPTGFPPARESADADFFRGEGRQKVDILPLTADRYKLQVTISRATHDKLRRAQDLLRHRIPTGDPGLILDRALTLLVEELERKKAAATTRSRDSRSARSDSRHIPAAVRRAVWVRDEGQCAFVGTLGRCQERGFLEFHHETPFARGGQATVQNIHLRCRAHNAYHAEQEFGPRR